MNLNRTARVLFGLVLAVALTVTATACSPGVRPAASKRTAKSAVGSAHILGSIPSFKIIAPASGDPLQTGAKPMAGGETLLTGAQIVYVDFGPASPGLEPDGTQFKVTFDRAGTAKLKTVTSDRVGKLVAFVVGDTIIGSATVADPILDGKLYFTVSEPELAKMVVGAVEPRK
jgi:hypothetical protein